MTAKPTPRTLAHRANKFHKLTIDIPVDTYAAVLERAERADIPTGRMVNIFISIGLEFAGPMPLEPAPLANVPPASRAEMETEWQKVTK